MLDLHHQGSKTDADGQMVTGSTLWPNATATADQLGIRPQFDQVVFRSKQVVSTLVQAVSHYGYANFSRYCGTTPPGISRNAYGLLGSASVLIEMRGDIGQKSNGYIAKTGTWPRPPSSMRASPAAAAAWMSATLVSKLFPGPSPDTWRPAVPDASAASGPPTTGSAIVLARVSLPVTALGRVSDWCATGTGVTARAGMSTREARKKAAGERLSSAFRLAARTHERALLVEMWAAEYFHGRGDVEAAQRHRDAAQQQGRSPRTVTAAYPTRPDTAASAAGRSGAATAR